MLQLLQDVYVNVIVSFISPLKESSRSMRDVLSALVEVY